MPEKKQVALPKYCESVYHSVRRPTRTINVRLPFACSLHLPQSHRLPAGVCLWSGPLSWLSAVPGLHTKLALAEVVTRGALAAQIGPVQVGSEHPVRVQTMTTTGACSPCPSLLHLALRFRCLDLSPKRLAA